MDRENSERSYYILFYAWLMASEISWAELEEWSGIKREWAHL